MAMYETTVELAMHIKPGHLIEDDEGSRMTSLLGRADFKIVSPAVEMEKSFNYKLSSQIMKLRTVTSRDFARLLERLLAAIQGQEFQVESIDIFAKEGKLGIAKVTLRSVMSEFDNIAVNVPETEEVAMMKNLALAELTKVMRAALNQVIRWA